MKRAARAAPVIAALSLALTLAGCGAPAAAPLAAEIDALVRAAPDTERVLCAVRVVERDSGAVLYDRHPHLPLHPASSVKLVTLGAALHAGLAHHALRTVLCAPAHDGAPWMLIGDGDALLSEQDLEQLVDAVHASGRRLTGALLVDGSALPGPRFGHGWMWDDEPAAYMPHLSALTLAGGAVRVRARAHADHIEVDVQPASDHLRVANELTLLPAAETAPEVHAPATITRERDGDGRRVTLRGALRSGEEIERRLSVPAPDLFTGAVLKRLLVARGLADADLVVRARAGEPAGAALGTCARPLAEAFAPLLKHSDNLGAELLLRRLGRHREPDAADATRAGLRAVETYLATLGHDAHTYRIVDGSGLSHLNLVSAELLCDVLCDLLAAADNAAVLHAALPTAGADGTLADRMLGTAAAHNLRAKTGTLSGASTLCGFVEGADGRLRVFAILCNHHVGASAPWRALQDQIGAALARAH